MSSFMVIPPAHDPVMAGIESIPAVARLRASASRNRASLLASSAGARSSTASIGSPLSRADSDINSVASDSSLLDDSATNHGGVHSSQALSHTQNSAGSSAGGERANNPLFKTNLCREFSLSGTCPFGRRCHFAHGEHELRPVPPEFETTGSHRSGSSALSDQVYKTELCHVFMQLGACRYGVRCHFAHGFDELRPRWGAKKTPRIGKCIQFETTGKCRFGSRCRFLHGDKIPSECENSVADQFSRRPIPTPDLGAFMAPQLAAFSSSRTS
jgi:butyrate response factor 1